MRTPFGSIGGYDQAKKQVQDQMGALAQWSPAAQQGQRAGGSSNPYGQATANPEADGSYQTATGTTAQRPSGVANPYEMPVTPGVSIGRADNGGLMDPYGTYTAASGGKNQTPTGAGDRIGGDPLFMTPASLHLATSGEAAPPPQAQQGPNMYRYAGSEGWTGAAPGTKG